MRTSILLIFLFAARLAAAQLHIQPGAQVYISGTGQLTLHNTSLINSGTFITGQSLISFTGNASSSIGGSEHIQFYDLHIDKDNHSLVSLQGGYGINHRVYFTKGYLNLNGQDLDLGSSGRLIGETNESRIIGNGGGAVRFDTVLNSPSHVNPANLGVFISSAANMGYVAIYRRHIWDLAAPGLNNSVRRQYSFSVANNSSLNATLQFRYFEGELNNLQEDALSLYENVDGVQWNGIGFSSKNSALNYVERTGMNSLHEYTLSSIGSVLPVKFSLFKLKCQSNGVQVTWKTAQEQNSQRFDIEKSSDGVQWSVIGNLPAAGNSFDERSYSFTDPVSSDSYYRIAEYDNDGSYQYSSILRSSCASTENFRLWPNPTSGNTTIRIDASQASKAIVKLYDSRGALIKQQHAVLVKGSNQIQLDMVSLPQGVYAVTAEWHNGQTKQTVQVIKQ